MRAWIMTLGLALCGTACSDEAGPAPSEEGSKAGATDTKSDAAADGGGEELQVEVPESGRVYVALESHKVVSPEGDAAKSADWDLAFEGLDVFTNSGVSGANMGGAFGPFDASMFDGETAPQVPFLTSDEAGGAFHDWYAYEEDTHAIWSRYHVYGVRDGDRTWKLQVLNYYSDRDGSPVSALYKIRYAELHDHDNGETRQLDVDGTAGGVSASDDVGSGCVDLASGDTKSIKPADMTDSKDWQLCFRRSAINVNGGIGGPRGVTAVDLQAAATKDELIDDLMKKTADSEKDAFEAIGSSDFDGRDFRGDHVVSAFSGAWLDASKSQATLADGVWLVQDAAGKQKYMVVFERLDGATAKTPGTVTLRIKPVKG